MRTMADAGTRVTAGADTPRDQHAVAALDQRGAELGIRAFPTTPAGHREVLARLRGFGAVEALRGRIRRRLRGPRDPLPARRGRGAGGAPNRPRWRWHGRSDPVDALAAARSAQAGDAVGAATTRTGAVAAIHALRVARRSAVQT